MVTIKVNHPTFVAWAGTADECLEDAWARSNGGEELSQLPEKSLSMASTIDVFHPRSNAVRLRDSGYGVGGGSDKSGVRQEMQNRGARPTMSVPWAMEMKAVSIEEPSRLVQTLTGAILGCGGWVLSRGANDTGMVSMLFEFERKACVDIYSLLIAAGLELSQSGHIRFTELCQCTRNQGNECGTEIASVDLEIQTFPVEMAQGTVLQKIA
jgi:hypothetical protein